MFDAFPFDEWGEDIAEFWTFGGEGSTGTWIMTVLGFSVMVIALDRLRRGSRTGSSHGRRPCSRRRARSSARPSS